MKTPILLLALVTGLLPGSTSCASLHGATPEEARSALAVDARAFSSDSFLEIDGLEPQLEVPFRLAIAPRIRRACPATVPAWVRRESDPEVTPWTAEERARLEAHLAGFVERGTISEFVWTSDLLVDPSDAEGLITSVRRAALRERADAVLVIHSVETAVSEPNLLSVLDLTLVGALIVPGHEVHATAALGALLVDTRNEYLYLTALAEAEAEGSGAGFKLDARGRELQRRARLDALDRLAVEVEARSSRLLGAGASSTGASQLAAR